jgi:hypothetical protein
MSDSDDRVSELARRLREEVDEAIGRAPDYRLTRSSVVAAGLVELARNWPTHRARGAAARVASDARYFPSDGGTKALAEMVQALAECVDSLTSDGGTKALAEMIQVLAERVDVLTSEVDQLKEKVAILERQRR